MKKQLFLILTLLLSLNALGQKKNKVSGPMYQGNYSNKDFFNKAEYIFEGEVISNKKYLNEDTTDIFASSLIKINHVYKGDLKADTIEFVRDGGEWIIETDLGMYTFSKYHGGYLNFYCKKMIFFAKKRKGQTFNSNFKVKLEPFTNERYAVIRYSDPYIFNFKLYGLDQLYFNSINEFNKYAKDQMNNKNEFKKKDCSKDGQEEIDIEKEVPKIFDFNPKIVSAGVGDLVVIEGENFGNKKGRVDFLNADDGGSSYIIDTTKAYVFSWSDNKIIVKVPSFSKSSLDNNTPHPAGTGYFKVVTTKNKTALSPQELIVKYCLKNSIVPNYQNNDGRVYFVKNDSLNINGYTLTLHSNIAKNLQAVQCIEKVLCEWSSILGLELSLEKDKNGNYITVNSVPQGTKNIIYINPNLGSLMSTETFVYDIKFNDGGTYYFQKDRNYIQIKKQPSQNVKWNYSISGIVPAGEESFYNTFLHEVGHLLGLNHVIDSTSLMHYMTYSNKPQQIIKLDTTSMPVIGVNRNYDDSRNFPYWAYVTGVSKIEKAPPTILKYEINNGHGSTFFRKVKLNNNCKVCATHYMASEDPTFADASWKEYETAPKFKIKSKGKGNKTVYFKTKNVVGESNVKLDNIILINLWEIMSPYDNNLPKKSSNLNNYSSTNDITVYPIPFTDDINIAVPEQLISNYKIEVINLNGVTVFIDKITTATKNLNLSKLRKGVYFIRFIDNKKVFVKKIIKR